ncbi:ripped pocket [Carabus blaptoides fortunei]
MRVFIFIHSILCSCLPACYEITYSQDHSLGDISRPELRSAEANTTALPSLIVLNFFYQQTQFRSYQKSELFGFTEFLSNSGGLLGLFLGFSFLSAVEFGYHLTLRLWCVYYRKHKETELGTVVYPFAQ